MSYTAVIDRANPTAFIFLIDQSRSMNEKMDAGGRKTKFVGDVLNKTLLRLMTRCASVDGVRDYFDIGILTYNGIGVRSGFGRALSTNALHPMSSLAAHPLRIEERKKRVPDGAGGLVDQSVKFPVWFESVSDGETPMCEGFHRAAECLVNWCNSHVKSYPPTLIHVTGGPSTDGNPEQLAESIRHISTNHGQCLLFNLHVDSSGSAPVMFPASEASLPDAYSKMLFRMSSLIPAHLIGSALEDGYNASSQSRFLGCKASYEDLANFFDIGTRVSNLVLRESTAPRADQTSARPATGSGMNNKFHEVEPELAEPASGTSTTEPASETGEPVGRRPADPTKSTIVHGGRPRRLQVVRMVGLAVAVIAAIVLFKLFGIGSGSQPNQISSQTPITPSQINPASERQSGDSSQSTGLSRAPNVTASVPTSDRSESLLTDAAKPPSPADNDPKLAGEAEQPTEPAHVAPQMPPPQNADQPKVAETRTAGTSAPAMAAGTSAPAMAAGTSAPAVNLDLTKDPDAQRVQQRLIELGYLSGVADGVWGSKSKRALSEFKTAEKMGQDDQWDQATESELFAASAARKQQNLAFVGGWAQDASNCANRDAFVKITASRAKSVQSTCDFSSIQQEAEGTWRVQAHCELAPALRTTDTENAWTANIELTLEDRRLTWESEKGSQSYYRCSQ